MLGFLTASQNLPFAVALAVMLGIAVLEGLLTLIGFGLSNALDSLLPDHEFDLDLHHEVDIHHDAHVEMQSPSALSHFLSWLRVGKVPVLMLFVVFLTAFGLIGLALQGFIHNLSGSMLPATIASIPALILSLPVVRMMGSLIAKIMPQDETEAVSRDSLIGRVATITLGTARPESPAEARVIDLHGTSHYVMVEPDTDDEFTRGDQVVLVRIAGSVFRAIRNPSASLVDDSE